MAKNIDLVRQRFKENPVRTAFNWNDFDRLKRFGIPHHDGTAAAKAMMRLGIDRRAVRPGVGDCSYRLERIEVKDQDLLAAGNIETAAIAVRIDIIDPAGAHGLRGVDDLVRLGSRGGRSCLGKTAEPQHAESSHKQDAMTR